MGHVEALMEHSLLIGQLADVVLAGTLTCAYVPFLTLVGRVIAARAATNSIYDSAFAVKRMFYITAPLLPPSRLCEFRFPAGGFGGKVLVGTTGRGLRCA